MNIALETAHAKLPIKEIKDTIQKHMQPMAEKLPDKRLKRVMENMVLGILGGETAVVTEIARQNSKGDGESWAVAKRIYRLMENKQVQTSQLYEGLYQAGCEAVGREKPEYLVAAVDPVNFEKPYVNVIEGASIVHKATPPDLTGHARLAHGYPAITTTIVNTSIPVTSYANWFSYQVDFISQNNEIMQAFATTCRLYPGYPVRFVGDSGLDDQKMFAKVGDLGQEFVFRASHLDRIVEIYNARLDRWETEALQDMTQTVLYQASFEVLFKHAGRTRLDTVHFGWFQIRLPENQEQILWVLVADDPNMDDRELVLITNVPLETLPAVQQVYNDWRLRSRIEHGYRFDQEQGLDVEDMRLHTLDRMRRLFAIVLLSAQIVFVIAVHWPPKAVLWLRQLGGKLGIASDRDGPYWLLNGLSAVIVSAMTLSFAFLHPFPFEDMNCG